ncbi:hypothetical protein A3Q56_01962 [Intoshia linei]|uniref:Uncharacterized protein n=1 Tax=Intoshia linei TaxID=1819745 RepID=A0A177B7V2_9BILA|nr:hypothetical protein A3Q56_01962 [Intoshia linei]
MFNSRKQELYSSLKAPLRDDDNIYYTILFQNLTILMFNKKLISKPKKCWIKVSVLNLDFKGSYCEHDSNLFLFNISIDENFEFIPLYFKVSLYINSIFIKRCIGKSKITNCKKSKDGNSTISSRLYDKHETFIGIVNLYINQKLYPPKKERQTSAKLHPTIPYQMEKKKSKSCKFSSSSNLPLTLQPKKNIVSNLLPSYDAYEMISKNLQIRKLLRNSKHYNIEWIDNLIEKFPNMSKLYTIRYHLIYQFNEELTQGIKAINVE